MNGAQVAANLSFLGSLSYSLEELFWHPWDELFARDQEVTSMIMEKFIFCMTQAQGPFDPSIPEHMCWETRSSEKRSATVKMKMFCPL